MKTKKMIWCMVFVIIVGCALGITKGLYDSKNELSLSVYEISSPNVTTSLRILQLSDLHNRTFGDDNEELISLASEQEPDLILITGDLLNENDNNTDIATNLVASLSLIAPVYISLGNHELGYQNSFGIDVSSLFEAAGATVLEQDYVDILIKDDQIRLGGIYGYCLPSKYLETSEADPEECAFLEEFQDTDAYTVLMCHMPVCWLMNDGLDEWDVDCVLAGHVHGGQVILPLIGGLYAPDFGWFPGKLEGLYYSSDNSSVMVLSRGLGSTEVIPRFNNIPEVVVVDIVPE